MAVGPVMTATVDDHLELALRHLLEAAEGGAKSAIYALGTFTEKSPHIAEVLNSNRALGDRVYAILAKELG